MSKNHTPGPWSAWNFNDDPRHVAVGPEAGGLAVADIVACNAHGCYTAETEAKGIANARLIAASPELLDALEMALDASENCINDKSWEDAARAAIARAKGN